MWLSNEVGCGDLLEVVALSTVGNPAGGLLLVTSTHTAQARAR